MNCKYKNICKWYEEKTLWGDGCYEPSCWRAVFLDEIIPKKHLKTLELLLTNGQTKSNGTEKPSL